MTSHTRSLYAALAVCSCWAACGVSQGVGAHPLHDAGVTSDDAPMFIDDGGVTHRADLVFAGPCDDTTNPCPAGQRCYMAQCIVDNGGCTSDSQCQNDTYCSCSSGAPDAGTCGGGTCIPYGTGTRGGSNSMCQTGGGFSASDFKPPTVKCSWTGDNVIMTPVVVDLDLDGKPEIVFVTFPYPSGQVQLIALHGGTCQVLWQKPVTLNGFAQIATADLDGDKYPEIVALDMSQRVVVFDHLGNLLATAPTTYSTGAQLGSDCSGPAIVDVDNTFPPEIVVTGQVLRYTKGAGLAVLFSKTATPAQWGNVTAAADLDGDGVPEIITGLQVYDGKTGVTKTPAAWSQLGGTPGAYPAVADFNHDKKPDIVIIQSSNSGETVSVWDWANAKFIFGPLKLPGGGFGGTPPDGTGWGGPPTVADFDGDGTPDFGAAGPVNYFVFAMKCWPSGGAGCAGPGILWKKKTHDISSGGTGSSVFDFNGDGKAEVVYRDECFFRVLNGSDGKTDFAMQITSGTCLEMPVVADVDGDGHAEVVVPSDNVQGTYCATTAPASDPDTGLTFDSSKTTRGIFVLADPMNRWLPSRGLWNQHTYHITNINDDQSVPTMEPPNWSSYDNYRDNVQGVGTGNAAAAADLTGAPPASIDNGGQDCKVAELLWAQICNRGAAGVGPGVPGTFYASDPRQPGAMKICSTATKGALMPGQCEAVNCNWTNPPQGAHDIYFRADDNGMKPSATPECNNDNDLLIQKAVTCSGIG